MECVSRRAAMWNKLVNAFRYLFYRSYAHQLTQWKGDVSTAVYGAAALITLVISLGIYAALCLILSIFGKDIPDEIALPDGLPHVPFPYVAAAIVLMYIQALYLHYMRKGRYSEIVKEYSQEGLADRKRHTAYIYIYVVATILLYIASLVFGYLFAPST